MLGEMFIESVVFVACSRFDYRRIPSKGTLIITELT